MMIKPNSCDLCQEIWNKDNLISIPITDSQRLLLCPDCYNKFEKFILNIKITELKYIRDKIQDLIDNVPYTSQLSIDAHKYDINIIRNHINKLKGE